jgi:diguanylate cyclase (GGDEF)-like protein/PAS domain S-box-containing protein
LDDTDLGQRLEGSFDAVFLLEGEGRIDFCNPSAATLFGMAPSELVGRSIASFLPGLPMPVCDAVGTHRLRLRSDGGEPRHFEVSVTAIDALGVPWHLLLIARPGQRGSVDDARRPAVMYDALTLLPNRALFTDYVAHAVAGIGRRPSAAAVLLLGIDRFVEINASLGHATGDDVLRAVAERVRGGLRASDTLARFGEDQFGVLVRGRTTRAAVAALTDRIQSRLLRPFRFGGVTLYVTMGIGVALARAGDSADELLRQADVALLQAKQIGPGRVEVFTREMSAATADRRQVEADLRVALERDELEVFYQPQIRLTDGALTGFEALVRWRQPGHGLRPPSDFLDVAATTGLIVPMGRFVLREACRQVGRWQPRRRSGPLLMVSVNLSTTEILQPDLVDAVRSALVDSGLPAHALELEITETAVLEASDETLGVLHRLKELGVALSIDDFGIGYSYLSHLRDFPIDQVKIDRSFVAGLGAAGEDRAIVEAVVRLAHELALSVVAEGVETKAQAALLAAMGCDIGQGYHYAPPLNAGAAALFRRAALPAGALVRPATQRASDPVAARA